jgi:ABC-type glycerol-3-phosphate transport system substrate-binding protein
MSTIEFMTGAFDSSTNIWLQRTLSQFSQESHITAKSIQYSWEQMWRELVTVGIYRRGPDLAEVGTTWMESLVAMNSLRPFSKKEVDAIGGEAAFMPSSWKSTSIGNDSQVWGIPFRADVRVIFYWRDMAEKAGVIPERDFSSPAALYQACKALKSSMKYPWATSTDPRNHNTVYNAASWVWAKGGDFVSMDGKSTAFTSPEAMEGLCDFFSLREFMPSGAALTDAQVLEMFARREIATFIGGPWTLAYLQNPPLSKELMPLLGVALPPGPPFVGGTVLMIWEHSRMQREALELIRYLCAPDIQTQLSSRAGLLPVRVESWAETMPQSQHYQILNNALTLGRPLPVVMLWGMIEEKLMMALGQVWATLDENPTADVEKALRAELDPLAGRLNNVLSS